jgi:hypothetical protein
VIGSEDRGRAMVRTVLCLTGSPLSQRHVLLLNSAPCENIAYPFFAVNVSIIAHDY